MHHHRIYLFTYLTVHIFSMFPLFLCCEIVIFFCSYRNSRTTSKKRLYDNSSDSSAGSHHDYRNHHHHHRIWRRKKITFFFASIFFSWQEMCLSQSSIFPVCFIPTISCSSKSIIAIATKRNNCLFCTNVNKPEMKKISFVFYW